MDFHVMTLFPDMIMDGLNTSITGRAIKAGVMSVKAYDIREYSNCLLYTSDAADEL